MFSLLGSKHVMTLVLSPDGWVPVVGGCGITGRGKDDRAAGELGEAHEPFADALERVGPEGTDRVPRSAPIFGPMEGDLVGFSAGQEECVVVQNGKSARVVSARG